MTVNLAIGYCTPPMGVSLFITIALARKDFFFISKSVMPFLFIQLLVLIIITYLPQLTLFLPRILGFVH
jgi:C4-dicarboxylate transporter DctM subunit